MLPCWSLHFQTLQSSEKKVVEQYLLENGKLATLVAATSDEVYFLQLVQLRGALYSTGRAW